jgi:putative spermidine/putrescine transport system substrate-binding protein
MKKRILLAAALGACAVLSANASGGAEASKKYDFGTGPVPVAKLAELSAKEGKSFVTYGIPENWAGYKELFEVFNKKYAKEHFDTDLSSGEEIAKMKAEKGNPQADVGDIGITWGPKAISEGVAAAYKHSHWDDIPSSYKDAGGAWCAWYTGTFMVMVNEDLVPRVPEGWKDLLDPAYKGKVTIGDPRTAAMYLAAFWAANLAMGGSETDIDPGIQYFKRLREIGNMNMINPSKASFAKGEVPIYFGWDYLFLNWAKELRDESKMKIATFIPSDGSVSFPYVYMINSAAPHPASARLWIEFMFSDEAQIINAKYFARPARRSVKLPPEVEALYPPKEAYKSVKPFDWIKADAVKDEFIKRWTNEVLGE